MVFGDHVELTLGIVIVPRNDDSGGARGYGNADSSRHDAGHELPDLVEYPHHRVHPIASLRSCAPQIIGRSPARCLLTQSTRRGAPKVLSEVKRGWQRHANQALCLKGCYD